MIGRLGAKSGRRWCIDRGWHGRHRQYLFRSHLGKWPSLECRCIAGFTLVEMSIVLMIIGLVLGGITVARELILQAEIRATISQYESFNVAARSFQLKYGGLPGDLAANAASALGFLAGDGSFAMGNNDGLISNGCPANANARFTFLGNEGLAFWYHLASANLVGFQPDPNWTSYVFTGCFVMGFPVAQTNPVMPPAKFSSAANWMVFEDGTTNNYLLTHISFKLTSFLTVTHLISPQVSLMLDSKIDDGKPLAGKVMAVTIASILSDIRTVAVTQAAASGVCVTTETDNPYNTANPAYSEVPSCSLRLRMQ